MKRTYQGSCHCGAVRFAADIDLAQGAREVQLLDLLEDAGVDGVSSRRTTSACSPARMVRDYQFGKHVIHHRLHALRSAVVRSGHRLEGQ